VSFLDAIIFGLAGLVFFFPVPRGPTVFDTQGVFPFLRDSFFYSLAGFRKSVSWAVDWL